MKIWLSSDGKNSGGKRYYARVEEVMVDKNGKPVYVPTPAAMQIAEPAAPAPAPVVAPAAEPAPIKLDPIKVVVETVPVAQPDNGMVTLLGEVVSKCDAIIDLLANSVREVVVEEVLVPAEEEVAPAVEEAVEEPAEEAVEEPAEEAAATEAPVAIEEPAEEAVEEPAPAEGDSFIVIAPVVDVAPAEEVAEEPVAVEEPAEVAVEVAPVAPAGEAKAPAVRSRCFAEKMRDASEIIQDRYDELKNYALRFRKLKSRISRKFDSINQGRFQFVKLSVAGKTLKLYLNMDINTTDPKFHCKDMSDKKTYVTVPTMLRIKSGRAVKYAKILIDQCAEQHGMLERRKPFIVDAMALIEESLAAKELPDTDVDVDTDVDTGDAE